MLKSRGNTTLIVVSVGFLVILYALTCALFHYILAHFQAGNFIPESTLIVVSVLIGLITALPVTHLIENRRPYVILTSILALLTLLLSYILISVDTLSNTAWLPQFLVVAFMFPGVISHFIFIGLWAKRKRSIHESR